MPVKASRIESMVIRLTFSWKPTAMMTATSTG